MRLLLGILAVALVAGLTCACEAADSSKLTTDRDRSVINAFEVMCTLERPNFEHINAKATAMRMILRGEHEGPSHGATMRSKVWFGALTNGPFLLLLDEMTGAKRKATSCAIVGQVADDNAFRAAAIATMKLPIPPQPERGSDGSRSYVWNGFLGSGTILILRDFKPTAKPGVMLKLVVSERSGER